MIIFKFLAILFVLFVFNSNAYAEDCDAIKMNSSVNIIKKMKCKAGGDTSVSSESSEKKDGILSKIWKKPEWMKKKN